MVREQRTPRMLTTGEAADYCGVSFRTVSRWVERGLLRGFELPGRGDKRIESEEFVRFLRQHGMPVPEELQPESVTALVVDDDPSMANAMARVLRRSGIEPHVANDGLSAGVLLEQYKPALILLDLQMPGLSGTQVLRFVRAAPRLAGIKILIVSGMPREDLEGAMENGADGYLEKPFPDVALREKVFQLLGTNPENGIGKGKRHNVLRTERSRKDHPAR